MCICTDAFMNSYARVQFTLQFVSKEIFETAVTIFGVSVYGFICMFLLVLTQ